MQQLIQEMMKLVDRLYSKLKEQETNYAKLELFSKSKSAMSVDEYDKLLEELRKK